MAGQVVVELTARDKVSGVLDRISASSKKLNRSVRDATGKLGRSFNNLKGQATKLQSVLVSLGAAAAVKGFAQAGIEADRTAKRLKFLGDQFGETAKLQAFAQEAAEKFTLGQTDAANAVSDMFGRLRPMGIALEDIKTVFNGVNVAAKQMNLSSEDLAGTTLQLSQALGSGRLQGDEFVRIMESLPKIGQTIAKTMRVPINQLKKLSSEGKITTEVIIKALKKIEKQGFPEPDGAAAFTKAMKDLSTAIGQRLTPVLNPVLKLIAGLVNKFLELPKPVQAAVIGFTAVAGAFAVIAPLLPAIAAGIAGIIAVVTGPVGIVAGIAGAVAGFFAMKGAAEESKEPMVQVNDEAAKTKAAVEAAARAKQEFIEKTKEHISALEAENAQITAAEQAYENTIKVTDARLNAESEINKLQGQILERAYEQAGSARERLNIAAKIYQNEVAGARIAYQQTLNSIEAEKQRLLFRLQTAQVEARIIQAKGELAAAEADSAEKAQLILDKTQLAVQAQQESVRVIAGQITAQNRIAEQQKIAAAAVLRQKELTAQSKLESKLVGDKIVRSKEEARRLSENLAGGNTNSRNLATATGQVAINARNSAHMFIRVADNADSAARAISRAAAAQRELNAARAAAAAARAAAAAQQGGQAVQQAAGGYNRGSFKAFARGGVVKGPTLGLIGEGGEPEYIIPQSKAAGFSANYLAGKRGISAVPGFAAGGVAMPSSANVSIQTGPVTQMNGQNFVTISEMSAAVRAGVEQTLDLIQRDGMIRAGLSI